MEMCDIKQQTKHTTPLPSTGGARGGSLRYFIYLSYDGTNYHGWQIQPNANSVQAELQHALSTILREEMAVTGAGRTDTGVHARMMVAHFDFPEEKLSPFNGELEKTLAFRLNRILPRDIAVQKVEQVSDDMHARFSATSRTYHYYINTQKSPFARHYSLELHYQLDFNAMNEAGEYLTTVDDFASFCKVGSDAKTTICDVRVARWVQTSPTEWYFEITADRFLRNMVRAVVGTLIEVGRGRMSLQTFKDIVAKHHRTAAGESMPAHALFLEEIKYGLSPTLPRREGVE